MLHIRQLIDLEMCMRKFEEAGPVTGLTKRSTGRGVTYGRWFFELLSSRLTGSLFAQEWHMDDIHVSITATSVMRSYASRTGYSVLFPGSTGEKNFVDIQIPNRFCLMPRCIAVGVSRIPPQPIPQELSAVKGPRLYCCTSHQSLHTRIVSPPHRLSI